MHGQMLRPEVRRRIIWLHFFQVACECMVGCLKAANFFRTVDVHQCVLFKSESVFLVGKTSMYLLYLSYLYTRCLATKKVDDRKHGTKSDHGNSQMRNLYGLWDLNLLVDWDAHIRNT